MPRTERRTEWVAYVRVSTTEQAERDLSLPAQRRAIETYAKAHGATIAREFVEEGHSGTDPHRPAFRCMLEDALRPGSDAAVIVVHHSSRFTRDATEARVVKTKLRRAGVRVCEAMGRRGVLTRPIGNVVALMPPYCTTPAQARRMVGALRDSIAEVFTQGRR